MAIVVIETKDDGDLTEWPIEEWLRANDYVKLEEHEVIVDKASLERFQKHAGLYL